MNAAFPDYVDSGFLFYIVTETFSTEDETPEAGVLLRSEMVDFLHDNLCSKYAAPAVLQRLEITFRAYKTLPIMDMLTLMISFAGLALVQPPLLSHVARSSIFDALRFVVNDYAKSIDDKDNRWRARRELLTIAL